MIEKLDIELTQSVATNHCIINKINTLIDAVNALVYEHDKDSDWYDGQTRAENVQTDTESRPENVQDKFAEQRRWIGKLCQFWDFAYEHDYFDTLKGITDDGLFIGHNGAWKHCEPVKPTDSIIYKGGDNE